AAKDVGGDPKPGNDGAPDKPEDNGDSSKPKEAEDKEEDKGNDKPESGDESKLPPAPTHDIAARKAELEQALTPARSSLLNAMARFPTADAMAVAITAHARKPATGGNYRMVKSGLASFAKNGHAPFAPGVKESWYLAAL